MRRLLPLLLLLPLGAPFLCQATPDHDADKATVRRDACLDAPPPATVVEADARHAPTITPATTRNLPKSSGSTETDGGGNDSEAIAPRVRGTRWHSFLPGMFR